MLAAGKKRHQIAVAIAAIVIGGLGLAAPLLIDGSTSEIAVRPATLAAASRDTFTLSSPVSLDILPRVRLERGSVSVGRATDSAMTGAAVLALLTGGAAKLVLDQAVLSVDLAAQPNIAGIGAHDMGLAPLVAALVSMSFSELVLNEATIRLNRADGSFESLSQANLKVTRQRSGRIKTAGTFMFRGERVSLDASIAAKVVDAGGTPGWPLQIDVKSALAQISATGTVAARETLNFNATESDVTISSIRKFARWLGAEWGDGRGLEKLRIKGPLEWTPRGIAVLQASVEIDGNEATGTLAIKLANQRAAIDGTLNFDTLDVGPYVAQAISVGDGSYFDFASYLPPRLNLKPVFPILKDVDADLRISADKVTSSDTKFGRSAASLSLKNGTMLADLAELEMTNGGKCAGQLSIDASGGTPHYRLKAKLTEVDVGLVSGALVSYAALAGLGTTTLDLTASGIGRQSILQSLAGKLTVAMPAAAQINVDVRGLVANSKSTALNGWGSAARRQTEVDGLAADFNLVNGRMMVARAIARAGADTLSLSGGVELASGMSDLQLWLMHPDVRTPGIGDIVPAGEALVPTIKSGAGVQIQGPLQAPSIRYLPLSGSLEPSPPPAPARATPPPLQSSAPAPG